MKKIFYTAVIVLATFMISCEKEELPVKNDKEDETEIETEPEIQFPTAFEFPQIISRAIPGNNDEGISNEIVPKVVFKNGPKQDLLVVDTIPCRVVIDSVQLSMLGATIPFDTLWKNDSTLKIVPQAHLAPNSQYDIFFKAHFEVDSLGIWIIPALDLHYEVIDNHFSTIVVSTTVFEADNIKYTYPVQNQYHYLQDEFHGGFIQLKAPQDVYFGVGGTPLELKVKVSGMSGYSFTSAATYSPDTYQISFDMPSDLENETIYALELFKVTDGDEEQLLVYHFRTSVFNKFEDKVANFIDLNENVHTWPRRAGVHLIYTWYESFPEYLDKFEMSRTRGLIRPELQETSSEFGEQITNFYSHIDKIGADFDRNLLGEAEYKSLYYDSITIVKILNGEIDLNESLGLPPKECMYLNTASILPKDSLCLNENQIYTGVAPALEVSQSSSGIGVYSVLMDIADVDYVNARNWLQQRYDRYSEDTPDWAKQVFEYSPWPAQKNGTWDINLNYTLPNGVVTSTRKIKWIGPNY